jgi:hypothetical protein
MRYLWLLLAVVLGIGIYLYQTNPDFKSRVKNLPAEAGLTKKTTRLYKWQDEDGQLQITDRLPPEGILYEILNYREDENVLPLPPGLEGDSQAP